jgi:hypothetical protein
MGRCTNADLPVSPISARLSARYTTMNEKKNMESKKDGEPKAVEI